MGGGRHDCKYGQWLATGRRGLRLSPLARPACELAAARPHGRCPHMYAPVWQTCPRRPPAPTTGSGRPARRRVRPAAHVPSLSRSAPPRVCPKGPPLRGPIMPTVAAAGLRTRRGPPAPDGADQCAQNVAAAARLVCGDGRQPVRRRRRPANSARVRCRAAAECMRLYGRPARADLGDGRRPAGLRRRPPARPSDPRRPRRPPTAAVCVIFLVVAAVSRPWPHG